MEFDKANVLLHNHTEYSARDGAMSVQELVDAAKNLGAQAVALTDHGNMVGVFEFAEACKLAEIKAIFGVEAYYCETPDSKESSHLILMAKDADGYRAVIKAVSESQQYIFNDHPRMTTELLRKYFGVGGIGHGHVVATSACMGGVLASMLLQNEGQQREIDRINKRRNKMAAEGFSMDAFLDMQHTMEEKKDAVDVQTRRVAAIKGTAEMKLSGLKTRLKTIDGEEAEALSAEISAKEASIEVAVTQLPEEKQKLANLKRAVTEYKKEYDKQEAKAERWAEADDKIAAIEKTFLDKDALYAMTVKRAKLFMDIFGSDFFVEVQYHGIDGEAETMPLLVDIADELGIDLVAANDAHYATNSADDIRRRDLLSTLRYPDMMLDDNVLKAQGHGELYLKSDIDLKVALNRIIPMEATERAMKNTIKIAEMCVYVPEVSTHYPKYKGDGTETAAERLTRLAKEGIQKRYPDSWDDAKQKRMEYELDVIVSQGYADYLCIVQDYLAYGRSLALTEYPEQVGYTIGPGRGSAAGSLVCYLVGITAIDPLKYNLLFERFLNKDRVSIPDIDADFHTELRGKCVEYVKQKYGEKAVCGIITKGRMAGKSSIKSAGRITGVPLGTTTTVSKLVPSIPNAKISDGGDELQALCEQNAIVAQLIKDAKLIEGRISSYGAHAAGIIISDNEDVSDYVPLMMGETGLVAQCDMIQCEFNAGLNKMDFLGLKNLDIITDTLRRVYRNYGIRIDMEQDVGFEKEVLSQIYSMGNTNSVFQFESSGMKDMLRKFKPDTFEDLILLVAAYRPGPMQYLPDIIDTKQGKKKPYYIAKGLQEILGDTYGKPIYQEQVMQICNKVAGFSLGEADIVRRAMSKKKLYVLTDPKTNYQGKFISGLIANGATQQEADAYWASLLDFASYAFNKSHAAAYALVSYYTAWLKYKYPAEYMCSVMARTDLKKLPKLLSECKQMGLSVSAPDVNRSDVDFSNVGNQILFGFNNIRGVGNAGESLVAMRKEGGKFISVKNFVSRIMTGKGAESSGVRRVVFESLVQGGGFDAFCGNNRNSILSKIDDLCDTAKKIKDKEIDVEERKVLLEKAQETGAEKEIKKAQRLYDNSVKALDTLNAGYDTIILTGGREDKEKRLEKEKEILGVYISGHPLDDYGETLRRENAQDIGTLHDGSCTVCGIISDIIFKTTKAGLPIAFFTLSDTTGECEIKCWSKELQLYRELLVNGAIVRIDGQCILEIIKNEEGEEVGSTTSVAIRSMRTLKKVASRKVLFTCKSVMDWQDYCLEAIKPYIDEDGCECLLHDKMLHEMRKCSFRVKPEIVSQEIKGLSISMV